MEKKWEEALSRTKLLSVSVSPSSTYPPLTAPSSPWIVPLAWPPPPRSNVLQCSATPHLVPRKILET